MGEKQLLSLRRSSQQLKILQFYLLIFRTLYCIYSIKFRYDFRLWVYIIIMDFHIPLLSLNIAGRRYNSISSWDLMIIYDKTCRLCIRVQVEGELKGTYVVHGISGEALYLHSPTNSLEGMIVKLLLETTDPVHFERSNAEDHVRCNMIEMEANVEEAGRIRKLLMTLRGEALSRARDVKLYEGIPQWSLLLPWWLYSKRLRIIIQQVLTLYFIFNTFWALWQLYRHVDIIRETLEPLIILIQETCHIYVSFAIEAVNVIMEYFSNFWWKFFAPLQVLIQPLRNIQLPLLMSPLIKLVISIYSIFGQILFPIISLLVTVSMTTTSLLWYMVTTLLKPLSWLLWVMFSYILRPLFTTVQYVPGLAKTSVDPVKVLVRSLLLNGFKSTCKLLLWIARVARIHKYNEHIKETHHSTEPRVRLERRYTTNF